MNECDECNADNLLRHEMKIDKKLSVKKPIVTFLYLHNYRVIYKLMDSKDTLQVLKGIPW